MSTAIAKKPLRQVSSVRELLVNDMARNQLATVAASHMKPERMMRLMAGALRTTRDLDKCDPLSLLGAMMTCASIGLEPNTVLGQAYLIPFKNGRNGTYSVQLIIGYKGMIDLARRSGHIVNIHADVVYEGDEFSFEYGSNQHLTHRPSGPRETPTHAYCHAKLTDGEAFVVYPYEEVLKIRNSSQGYKAAISFGKTDTPWIAHEHQMARKTMVRALFNELPISVEAVSDAIGADDRSNSFGEFAMDPTAGLSPEGAIDGEATEVDEAKPEPEQQEPEPKPAAKKPATKTKAADPQDEAPTGPSEAEAMAGLIDLIKGEIDDCASADEVEAVLSLYEEQIEPITGTPAHEDLMAYADLKVRGAGQ